MNCNCSNFLDLRNLQEQVKKAFCYQKLFWPFTVQTNCFSDHKIFAHSASNFKSFSRSLEHFFLTVDQNNSGNKIPIVQLRDYNCVLSCLKKNVKILIFHMTRKIVPIHAMKQYSTPKNTKRVCFINDCIWVLLTFWNCVLFFIKILKNLSKNQWNQNSIINKAYSLQKCRNMKHKIK